MARYAKDALTPDQEKVLDDAQITIKQALDEVRKRMPDLAQDVMTEWPGPGDFSCMSDDGCEGYTGPPPGPCRTRVQGGTCGHAFTRHWVF